MHFLGFSGAWLLFAGPIYQGALELQDENIEFDRLRAASSKVEKPASASILWWFIPPVKLHLEYRRRREYEKRILDILTKEDLEAFISYRSKASAWMFVALGGFCIAVNETYALTQRLAWNRAALLGVVVIMLLVSITNLIYRIRKAQKIKKS